MNEEFEAEELFGKTVVRTFKALIALTHVMDSAYNALSEENQGRLDFLEKELVRSLRREKIRNAEYTEWLSNNDRSYESYEEEIEELLEQDLLEDEDGL